MHVPLACSTISATAAATAAAGRGSAVAASAAVVAVVAAASVPRAVAAAAVAAVAHFLQWEHRAAQNGVGKDHVFVHDCHNDFGFWDVGRRADEAEVFGGIERHVPTARACAQKQEGWAS